MATAWLDPGGSATGGTQFWSSIVGAVTAQTSVNNGQAYAYQATTSSPAAGTFATRTGVLAAAGRRISAYFRLPALPTGSDTVCSILRCQPTGSGTALLNVVVDTAGKIRLYTNNATTLLGAASTTALSTNTWYRVSLCYAITSTTNWGAKVYIANSSGTLLETMTRTNADGTLSSAAPVDFATLALGTALGTNFIVYGSDYYIDTTTDQSDPGNIHVTAKLPTTTTTNNFDTTVGTGAVNERPVNTANGKQHAATTDVDQDYQIEADTAGAVDISAATIVDSMGWIWANLSSLTGTPASKIIVNGARVAAAWDSTSASTTVGQLFTTIVGSATYPRNANGKNIGTSSSTIAADTYLFDCGVVVAYIPSTSNNYTRDVAGNQPSATGALTATFLVSLAGSQPAPTGTLTNGVHSTTRSLSGNQPNATGALTRVKQALRSAAGNQPNATGALSYIRGYVRSLSGNQPTATGTLAAQKFVSRSLAGSQPTATGALTNGVHATTRALAGDQPAATGSLARKLQALRALAGIQPNPTGTLARLYAALRALTGNQPSANGALIYVRGYVRSLAGSQPAASGTITALKITARSLAGSQPTATGTLARIKQALRSSTGDQPTATGALTRKFQALRSLAGDQPNATGTLGRVYRALRSLSGNQPNATGTLTALAIRLRSLAGNQPAATGTLTKLVIRIRSLAGNQPAATGTLARRAQVSRSLSGDQPAASGSLTTHATLHRSIAGDQPAATGSLNRLLTATRVMAGNEPAASGALSIFQGVPNVRGFVFGSVRSLRGVSGREYAVLRTSGELVRIGGTVTGTEE